jgi:hypothetical protein
MKYGTIWSTRRIERIAPPVPGRAKSGARFSGEPRTSPRLVKMANRTSNPKVRTFWKMPEIRIPTVLIAAMTSQQSPAAVER